MEDSLGHQWFNDVFLKHCGPVRPQLLILDQHRSHEVLELVEMAMANNIILLALPSHVLQPLDNGCFASLGRNYDRFCSEFMGKGPQHVVVKATWAKLFAQAWSCSMLPETIKNSFRVTGISPFNPNVLDHKTFAPSEIYNIPTPTTGADNISDMPITPDVNIIHPHLKPRLCLVS